MRLTAKVDRAEKILQQAGAKESLPNNGSVMVLPGADGGYLGLDGRQLSDEQFDRLGAYARSLGMPGLLVWNLPIPERPGRWPARSARAAGEE